MSKELRSALLQADSLVYAAMATAYEGLEACGDEKDQKRYLVIDDLLRKYRETIFAAMDGKAA